MELTHTEEIYLFDAARRSFRDMADQDYLSARLCYKNKLTFQFLWMAQQAVEKYIKAILLFNKIPVTNLRHDLKKGLQKINQISYLDFELSDKTIKFIDYLNEQGPNRYFQNTMYTQGYEIITLDRAVWELRLYCKLLNYKIKTNDDKNLNLLEVELKRIESAKNKPAHLYSITGGYLEKRLKDNKFKQGDILTWKNFYFGKKRKKTIKIGMSMSIAHPTHHMHPEALETLSKFFKIY
ncbi:TPA: HEPN domain-containing protein [Citrobacter freundii]|uniref:HEPN domain-containing protein n=1 Tax=Citrobacter TaxID=544 RepID=UPI000B9A98B5|nr:MULTISPECIES: HEPN domain-containing protein [Citrobacter]EKU2332988.1 HEPN domain-containing protein [Citrobacter freundii]MBD5685191.1 HEPN domain-containing protein [Citrobacter freundii]MBE9969238.1 HEPN domain-containing protein [Citrobacter freundii]MBE9979039.1 HEPN domain-containing protein [Citrobacter freundii]MBE9988594.1 HEPN domain-containing protein [Citrobacter freundii]